MPYSGPSKGCGRCRQRHVKCDETIPDCRRCTRLSLPCPGYRFQQGLLFEDETDRTVLRVETREKRRTQAASSTSRSASRSTTPPQIPPKYEDAALAFFMRNFTIIAPEYASRAFTDIIGDKYAALSTGSPAALAARTLASELFSMWAPSRVAEGTTGNLLGKALKSVNHALSVHETAMHDDTLLAVVLLQFYTNMSRYKLLSKGSGDHQAGARAIIHHRGSLNFRTKESIRLLQTVRNSLISWAVRTAVRLDLDPQIWNSNFEEHKPKPAELDWLGLEVASLKADFAAMKDFEATSEGSVMNYNAMAVNTVLTKAITVDQRLRTWHDSLAPEWHPVRVAAPTIIATSMPLHRPTETENFTCDAYSSIQAADTWNQYRVYRLICLDIIWYCQTVQDRLEVISPNEFVPQISFNEFSRFSSISDRIQVLVDEICGSIPFHLGNRLERQNISEFSNLEDISWPLAPAQSSNKIGVAMSRRDVVRALIATGSWYILGPLSFLVQLFSPQTESSIDPPTLREGQLDWIKGQLLRVMEMHGSTERLSAMEDEHIRELRSCLRYTPGV